MPECIKCKTKGTNMQVCKRISYGKNVGVLCEKCCHEHLDHCGLYGSFGNLPEPKEENNG